uniref:Nucleotide modification associated domain-containing protein n=1 Tax=Blattabacterium sp. TaxID=34099 RepID=A0A7D5TM97_9FLAO|nr:hypothetical protein [Blattabacterium sp.]
MNNIDTYIQYNIISKKCKFHFKKKFSKIYLFFINFEKNNIINIILSKIHNNKWIDVINLCIIAIFFHEKNIINMNILISMEKYICNNYYDVCMEKAKFIMNKKNLDYGEAWKIMNPSSIKDIIVQKILRIQNIEENSPVIENFSEKIFDNYIDILNYSIFILIKVKK